MPARASARAKLPSRRGANETNRAKGRRYAGPLILLKSLVQVASHEMSPRSPWRCRGYVRARLVLPVGLSRGAGQHAGRDAGAGGDAAVRRTAASAGRPHRGRALLHRFPRALGAELRTLVRGVRPRRREARSEERRRSASQGQQLDHLHGRSRPAGRFGNRHERRRS